MQLQNPANYKTEAALKKALMKVSKSQMEVKTAIWIQNVKYTLIDNFGWNDKDASQFVAMWSPKTSAYAANS